MKAKYFVIKIRSDDIESTSAFFAYFSTTGKSGEGYSVSDDGTETIPSTLGYAYVRFLAKDISEDWTVFVVDLSAVLPDYYVADEDGNYFIDTFFLKRNSNISTIDVEFMAFAENWKAIDELGK